MENSNSPLKLKTYSDSISWSIALIMTVGIFEGVFFLQTLRDFWFDDDATLFAFVSGVQNPIAFFLSREVIAAAGFSFTPMQMFSYWLDFKICGTNPVGAYFHSISVFILTAIMLFTVLRCSQNVRVSLFGTIAWMFLPSTIVIVEFIGARHYMEGLLLTLLAVYFCYKNLHANQLNLRICYICLAIICLFFAMLCKEIFVTSGFLCVLLLLICNKRNGEAASVVILGIAYVCYRAWAIGIANKYPIPAMDVNDYLEFIAKLPYIFSGSYLGYLSVGATFAYGTLLAFRRQFPYRLGAVFTIFTVVSLVTIFPGSLYLSKEWQSQGTWYRLPFLLNLIFLIGGCLLLHRSDRRVITLMTIILTVSLVHGAIITRNRWDKMKDRYEVTGRFYITNKDKLVYSEVPAYWYLGGLQALYRLQHPFVLSSFTAKFRSSKVPQMTEVWRYRDGEMVSDSELWSYLQKTSP